MGISPPTHTHTLNHTKYVDTNKKCLPVCSPPPPQKKDNAYREPFFHGSMLQFFFFFGGGGGEEVGDGILTINISNNPNFH